MIDDYEEKIRILEKNLERAKYWHDQDVKYYKKELANKKLEMLKDFHFLLSNSYSSPEAILRIADVIDERIKEIENELHEKS